MEERRAEEIRQKLRAAGVIGGVVDDFVPLKKFYVVYGEKNISLGDEVSLTDVQSEPDTFYNEYHVAESKPEKIFDDSIFILVMTDPDTPGHEYLHWLITDFTSAKRDDDFPGDSLDIYEPPEPMRTSKMVFTLFRKPSLPIIEPISRKNFSTRAFANENLLGPPMAAGFFYIKIDNQNENENENDEYDNERTTSGTKCSTSGSTSKREKKQKR